MVLNSAFLFIKPHANTPRAKEVTQAFLEGKQIKIIKEGTITGSEIDEKNLIDNHYYSIASKATLKKPTELQIPTQKFKEKFSVDWDEVVKAGTVFNAKDACEKLAVSAEELDKIWAKAKADKKLVKFGGGFYCGKIEMEGKDPAYVINGFFMQMRSKYVAAGCSLHYYIVEWESSKLDWATFRAEVLGSTDPTTAPETSLRGQFFKNWKEYGLQAEPDIGDNAVHASASPFEALAEKMNWLGIKPKEDWFGSEVLKLISQRLLDSWKVDPVVTFGVAPCTKTQSLFDVVEDTDSDYCLMLLQMLTYDAKDSEYKQARMINEKLLREKNGYRPLEKAVDDFWTVMEKRGQRDVSKEAGA